MPPEIFEWLLLIVRWVHITTGVTWIGTSIFFMWLDRTFTPDPDSKRPGHVGDLWMVHGGGFYHVEKLQMGPTKVPESLHWFKWESYWTWMSGAFLLWMMFYSGGGAILLDSSVSDISLGQAIGVGIFSVVGSWLFYDFLWERKLVQVSPWMGHIATLVWFVCMAFCLTHLLGGRAAYMHIGAMLGTWMTGNVFLRIIPRQVLMVEAAKKDEPVNQGWSKNAKARSTHNTYFTLPILFIMLSNHFPTTYGATWNWLVLLLMSAGGALIRHFFVLRLNEPSRAKWFAILGMILVVCAILVSRDWT